MELESRPDFDKVLARMEAWWDCQIIDRPPVCIQVKPDRPPRLPEKDHANLRRRWFDLDFALDCMEASLAGAVFLGETFPRFEPRMGPELTATLFGCELEFGETTSWSVPVADSCRDIPAMQPDFDNVYWSWTRRAIAQSLERSRGRWITALPDLHTNGDLVAAVRNPQDFCLDLAEDIDSVRAACEHVTDFFPRIYEDLRAPIAAAGQPATTWAPFLHAGKAYVTSCDVIIMISPGMFQDVVLPSLVREMRYLERNFFHLDGPGALRHLDALLELPELDGLQWVYGAGHGPARKWIDVYRRAQAAGKCLDVVCEDIADALAVAEHLRPEGVWLRVGGAYTRDEAEAFLGWVERWAASQAVRVTPKVQSSSRRRVRPPADV